MFTNEDPTTIPAVGTEPKPAIGPLIVTIPGVIKQLQSLKPNKASGPDEIPPWSLKDEASALYLQQFTKPPLMPETRQRMWCVQEWRKIGPS